MKYQLYIENFIIRANVDILEGWEGAVDELLKHFAIRFICLSDISGEKKMRQQNTNYQRFPFNKLIILLYNIKSFSTDNLRNHTRNAAL